MYNLLLLLSGDPILNIICNHQRRTILIETKDFAVPSNKYCGDRVDIWWAQQETFPTLQKLTNASVIIFHGPQVEDSFSKMKDTMKTKPEYHNLFCYPNNKVCCT